MIGRAPPKTSGQAIHYNPLPKASGGFSLLSFTHATSKECVYTYYMLITSNKKIYVTIQHGHG